MPARSPHGDEPPAPTVEPTSKPTASPGDMATLVSPVPGNAQVPRTPTVAHTGPEGEAAPPGTQLPPPPDLAALAPPGYEVHSELARGGMGVIYRARQVSVDRPVALKMILAGGHTSAEALARFRTEAEAIARLQHPHIVQVFDVGEHAGLPYISLELCTGGTLEDRLQETPLAPGESAVLVEKLARAMQAAHDAGVIHRDLKPANVLFTQDGTPKITDFGLAKRFELDQERKTPGSNLTQTGSIMGTPSYMSPEQASGKSKELGPACDIYSLGAILYDCLTGRPPFKAATTLETLLLVANAEPVAPSRLIPRLPRDLETICLKCLEKEPRRRYASAGHLADDLHRYLTDEPIQARPLGRSEQIWRWGKRHPARAAMVAVSLLGIVALLTVGAVFNRRLAEELERTERARAAAADAERSLQLSLTRQVADRLDSDLRQLGTVPATLAALLARRHGLDEETLAASLRDVLEREPRLFGFCVAFEPRAFDPQREDFALYVYRTGQGSAVKQLLPPAYQPHYREWSWYRQARERRQALWGEPYLDEGGGNIPMITYSVPLIREGHVVGVVTADLSIAYFQTLRGYLEEVGVGLEGYGFLISEKGTFLSHPDPRYRLPRRLDDVAREAPVEGLDALLERMRQAPAGSARVVDFATGKPAHMLFARVATSGWTFVAVIPETEEEPAP